MPMNAWHYFRLDFASRLERTPLEWDGDTTFHLCRPRARDGAALDERALRARLEQLGQNARQEEVS